MMGEAAFSLAIPAYDLIGAERYPMLQDNDDDRAPEPPDRVETCTFVPKGSIVSQAVGNSLYLTAGALIRLY